MTCYSSILTWLSVAYLLLTSQLLAASPLSPRSAAVKPALSGPPRVIGSGTYPRANLLSDGSIIGAYTAFANGNNILTATHSTDGGVTWKDVGTINQGTTLNNDIDNPYILQLPSGRLLAAFRNHSKVNGAYTTFRITVCYSDDLGAHWTFLSQPASDPGPVHGNWEPFLRNGPKGSLQIYYSRENSKSDQDNLMRTSSNGGATWSASSIVSGGDQAAARDGMSGVTSLDGLGAESQHLLAIFETTQTGSFSIKSVTSADGGRTWANRADVYTPSGTRNNAGSPQVISVGGSASGMTLVASFMTDEDTQPHNWPTGSSAKLVTSADGGRTWANKLMFSGVTSSWPGLLAFEAAAGSGGKSALNTGSAPGTAFLALVEDNGGGAKAQKVVLS